tara:strand:- start:2688 stop:3308 length:621 start_codon:yes stop_codon:yes gene_type:complete
MNDKKHQQDLPLEQSREIVLTPLDIGLDSSWRDQNHVTYGNRGKWTMRRVEDKGVFVCRVPLIKPLLLAANYAHFRDILDKVEPLGIKRDLSITLHKEFDVACENLDLKKYVPSSLRDWPEVKILRDVMGDRMPKLFDDDCTYNGRTVREWTKNEVRKAIGLKMIEVLNPVQVSPFEQLRVRIKNELLTLVDQRFNDFLKVHQNDQ